MKFETYPLGTLCKRVTSGGTPKSTKPEYYGGDIPWLNTKDKGNKFQSDICNRTVYIELRAGEQFGKMDYTTGSYCSNVWSNCWKSCHKSCSINYKSGLLQYGDRR